MDVAEVWAPHLLSQSRRALASAHFVSVQVRELFETAEVRGVQITPWARHIVEAFVFDWCAAHTLALVGYEGLKQRRRQVLSCVSQHETFLMGSLRGAGRWESLGDRQKLEELADAEDAPSSDTDGCCVLAEDSSYGRLCEPWLDRSIKSARSCGSSAADGVLITKHSNSQK
eukprot:2083023-Pleurochrysis_carterae.AAC.5